MADFIKLPLQNVKALENKNNTSKAIELALKATEEDRKKNYHEAIKLYKNCNEILRQRAPQHLLEEKVAYLVESS